MRYYVWHIKTNELYHVLENNIYLSREEAMVGVTNYMADWRTIISVDDVIILNENEYIAYIL
jgi:hypothetical protein